MKNRTIKHIPLYIAAIGVSLVFLFFFIACFLIGYDVNAQCDLARHAYGGGCVDALVSLLDDENRSFRERNHAIWALGQLGDRRALPTLTKYYTGNIPAREPLDRMISQYELKKAVNLARGGVNITAVFWRYGIK